MDYTNDDLDRLIKQCYDALKNPLDRTTRDGLLYSLMVLEAKRHKQSHVSLNIH